MLIDRPGKHPDLVRRRGRRPVVEVTQHGQVQPGALEGVREIPRKYARRVVFVKRDPGYRQSLRFLGAAEVRERGRLAEAGRGLEGGKAALQDGIQALQERVAGHLARARPRRPHLRLQKPGRYDA